MDEFHEAELWLKAYGTVFRNRVVDLTKNNGYYISCTWVMRDNGYAFYADGDDYNSAVVSMLNEVKDKLFEVCNGS